MIKVSYRKAEEGQNLSELARELLREALGQTSDCAPEREIVFGPHGKPYFKGTEPDSDKPSEGEDRVFFNLSHSGSYALCVLCDSEVGCDIQKISQPRDSILKRIFHEEERDYILRGGPQEQMAERFTRIWALRESFIKQTGEGLSRSMRSFHIDVHDGHARVVLHGDSTEETGDLSFYEFKVEDYCCACCY